MCTPQQTGSMQAATLRCPPNIFRERYSLADFEVTYTYGEGPNWSISAARCKWSSAPVTLQLYSEAGNLSGCMALALAAAHGLTNHPSLLPLYAVFRDVAAGGALADGGNGDSGAAATSSSNENDRRTGSDGGSGGGIAARVDRVVMVYPGGSAQHPLDAGSSSSSSSAHGSSGGGSGPPVSERGVVRGLVQPLGELVAVLEPMGLRPPYVCGLDVWLDSTEAPGPGQALFMVPLMCHRRAHSPPDELLPAAVPYAAPYLRANPKAAGDPVDSNEAQARRWLSWSAAALVHAVLIGSPPPDKPLARKSRPRRPSDPPPASLPQLPPLTTSNSVQLPSAGGRGGTNAMLTTLGAQRHHQGSAAGSMGTGGGSGHGKAGSSSVNGTLTHGSKRSSGSRVADAMPLWLSDEAGDWFRRGLALDCASRVLLDEQMRHPWVCRHAAPRSASLGHMLWRESLGFLPRELHPLMLDVVPLGLTRPGREEVDHLMAEMAATEGPSAAKPALPWQVVEGPQEAGPPPAAAVVEVEELSPPAAAEELLLLTEPDPDSGTVIERYEVAEEQKDDGTRVVEELRVVSGKPDGALNRAAKALQAAMARRGDPAAGQWVMANPRGTTFDDIARQNQQQRPQQVAPSGPTQRRGSNGAPPPQAQRARGTEAPPSPPPVTLAAPAPPAGAGAGPGAGAGARASVTSVGTSASSGSGNGGQNRSPGPRGSNRAAKTGTRPPGSNTLG